MDQLQFFDASRYLIVTLRLFLCRTSWDQRLCVCLDRLQGKGGTGEALVGAVIGAGLLTVLVVVCCVVTFHILHKKRRRHAAIRRCQ